MKKTSLIILIAAFGILLTSLIVLGVVRSDTDEAKYATEDTIVSVTGVAADADAGDTQSVDFAGNGEESTQGFGADGKSVEDIQSPGSGGSSAGDAQGTGFDGDGTGNAKEGDSVGNSAGEAQRDGSGETGSEGAESGSGPGDGSDTEGSHSKTASPEATKAPRKTPAPSDENKHTCHFTIECSIILGQEDMWRDGLEEVVPESGVFFSDKVSYKKGQSVYDALKRICDKNDILLDADYTPFYDTYYVRGIGNLYEFDCGSESGWKYSVNGVLPGVGSSLYEIKDGDEIVFFYDTKI